jgi:hypothetical protein
MTSLQTRTAKTPGGAEISIDDFAANTHRRDAGGAEFSIYLVSCCERCAAHAPPRRRGARSVSIYLAANAAPAHAHRRDAEGAELSIYLAANAAPLAVTYPFLQQTHTWYDMHGLPYHHEGRHGASWVHRSGAHGAGSWRGRLLAAGFPLTVQRHRTRARAEALLAGGAAWAETPAEVTARSDLVFTILTDDHAVETVYCGRDGLLSIDASGRLFIEMSTIRTSTILSLAGMVDQRGARLLDAPVSGTVAPGARGATAGAGRRQNVGSCARPTGAWRAWGGALSI